ncbi:MAG: thiamine pyrophosphate-binding protein, partial [Candidatus Limnocylindria bacterium]
MADSANAGELIALALKRAGVSHLFTLNGGHIWPILMGASEHGIRIIDVRHEQSAAFAAEGWAKVTRQCGVAAVTASPGVTNSTSALAQAQSGDSPLFVIGGRAPQARWGMGSLQEMDHVELVKSITKKSVTLADAEDAYGLAAECVRTALSARTGPVFMDIPLDVFFGAADLPEATEHLTADLGASPDPDLVQRAARLIESAHRPAVIAGGSVWWAHAEGELKDLVETAQLPLTVNGMARGALPPGHPLFFPRARGPALGEADLIVVVGALLDFRLNFGQPPVFAEDARLIFIDVDGHRKHRAGEVSLYGDLKAALGALANAVGGGAARPEWLGRLREAEAASRRRDEAIVQSDSSPIHPARLIAEVDRFSDPDAIIVGDGGDFVSFAGRLIERQKPGLWIDP